MGDFYQTIDALDSEAVFGVCLQLNKGVLAGRAKHYFTIDDTFATKCPEKLRCEFSRMLLLLPNGRAFPCCSHQIDDMPFTTYNVYEYPMLHVLNCIYRDDPFAYILTYGFGKIVDFIRSRKLFSLRERYIDGCDLCQDLWTGETRRKLTCEAIRCLRRGNFYDSSEITD